MQKKGLRPFGIALIVIAVLAVIIVGIVALSNKPNSVSASSSAPSTGNVIAPPSTSTGTNSGMMKLSDSMYANYAYLISTDTLSSDAQQAIAGFQITKVSNPDGSTTYNLNALNPEYQNQSYTLQPGQSLYFIERSMGDDNDGNESFLGDDHAVVVDSSGNIVQGPTNLQ